MFPFEFNSQPAVTFMRQEQNRKMLIYALHIYSFRMFMYLPEPELFERFVTITNGIGPRFVPRKNAMGMNERTATQY